MWQPPQQPFPQPGAGQPPSGQAPLTGLLVLELRRPWGSMGMTSAVVKIDGYRANVRWGHNEFVVPAGPRRIDVASSYLWEYGRSTDLVGVQPGQWVVVHYSPPMFTMMSGRLGPTQMPYGGMPVFIAMMVAMGLVAVCILLVVVAMVLSTR